MIYFRLFYLGMALLLGSFSFSFAAAEGASGGGGGYGFYRTSNLYLENAKKEIVRTLSAITDQQLAEALTNFPDLKVNRIQLKEIVRHLKKDYLNTTQRKNPDGDFEPLLFDYYLGGENSGYIKATALFFSTFNRVTMSWEEYDEIRRLIFHEAGHVLGTQSDEESFKFSKAMLKVFYKHLNGCGYDGDVEQQILDCNDKKEIQGHSWSLVRRDVRELKRENSILTGRNVVSETWRQNETGQFITHVIEHRASGRFYLQDFAKICEQVGDELSKKSVVPSYIDLKKLHDLGLSEAIEFNTKENPIYTANETSKFFYSGCIWSDKEYESICPNGDVKYDQPFLHLLPISNQSLREIAELVCVAN